MNFLSSMSVSEDIANILHQSNAILFLNNPPYKTVNEQTFHGRVRRPAGHTNTVVKQAMKRHSLNRAGDQLSVQFMYKITEIMLLPICDHARSPHRSIYMGIFLPANLLTGPAYHTFRSYLLEHWEYMSGFMFPAATFTDVKGLFSIAFVIWRCRMNQSPSPSSTSILFDVYLMQPDLNRGHIEELRHLSLYPARPDQRLNLWARSHQRSLSNMSCTRIPLTSPLTVQTKCRYSALTQLPADALGYLHSNGNSIQHNGQLVGLYSSAFAAGHGVVVRPENFERVCVTFTVRRLISRTWMNWLLEYHWPISTECWEYLAWSRDTVIFALFDVKANQSGLRSPPIINQWFWMGRDQIRSIACDNVAHDLDTDQSSSERFVYDWITKNRQHLGRVKVSIMSRDYDGDVGREARALLEFAETSVRDWMWLRLGGDYQTQAWDAGWYQIRNLISAYGGSESQQFIQRWNELRMALAARLIDGVYTFGFLPRS